MPVSRGRKSKKQKAAQRRAGARSPHRAGLMPQIDLDTMALVLPRIPVEALPLYAIAGLHRGMLAGTPANDCQVGCLTLQHALAEFGIVSVLRVVQVTITGPDGGVRVGSLTPDWKDGAWTGHVLLEVPVMRRLTDPTLPQVASFRADVAPATKELLIGLMPADDWDVALVPRPPFMIQYQRAHEGYHNSWNGPPLRRHAADIKHNGLILANLTLELLGSPSLRSRALHAPYPQLHQRLT